MTSKLLASVPHHDPSCTGCPACSAEMAYLLAHPNGPRPRLVAANGHAIEQPEFRAAVQRWTTKLEHEFGADDVPPPPDLNTAVRTLRGLREPMPVVPRSAAQSAGGVPAAVSNEVVNAYVRAARGLE